LFAAGEVDCATNSLDYYRILGLPIQASAEQLQQAYRDRTLQLPRREYSETAIMARKQLLEAATGFYLIQNNALATMPAILPTPMSAAMLITRRAYRSSEAKALQNPLIQ